VGLFKKKKIEQRAEEDRSDVLSLFSNEDTVTRKDTLQVPTVAACISKVSEAVSMLPVRLYRKTEGKPEEVVEDQRTKLLNGDTGDTLNTVEFWKAMISDYYTGAGGWAYINSSGITVKSIHYVDCDNISILQNNDPIFKEFKVQVNGQMYYDFKFIKLLRKTKDGYTNIPIQEESNEIISAAYNSLRLETAMSQGSGCKGGFLKSKNKLSRDAIDAIREGYTALYDSFNKRKGRKVLVLNDGMEFQEISSTSAEMQMNENKRTNSIEICKLFGFPHTIIDGGASEEDKRQFIQAVTGLINQIETELDKCLLLESEKESGYYFAFDTKELMRGSTKERYEAYEIALRNRFLQIDEIRKEEDREPMGFNYIALGLGDVLLDPTTNKIFTPNTGQISQLDEMRASDDQPRDEKGRFAPTEGEGSSSESVDKSSKSDIIKSRDNVEIGTQFFAEKDISNQDSNSLKRAMRKYEKRISEHQDKVNNPEKHVPDWDNYSDAKKAGLIKHWNKEIRNFQESIDNRISELKERGDYDE